MRMVSPLPGQQDRLFCDNFRKWPRLFHFVVLVAVSINISAFILTSPFSLPPATLHDILTLWGLGNLLLLLWGLLLKLKAKSIWYRNYHIGKSLLLLIFLLIVDFLALTTLPQ